MTQWEMKCRYSVQTKKCSQLKKPILLAINLSLLSLNFMSLVMLRKNETLIMRDDLRHRGKYFCRDMPSLTKNFRLFHKFSKNKHFPWDIVYVAVCWGTVATKDTQKLQ